MHKIAFDLGGFTIYWYGVMVAAGFLAGIWTASRRALRENIAPERIVDLGPWLILGALAGARAFYVVMFWDTEFASQPWWKAFMIRQGGLVYYGGFIGAGLAVVIYLRYRGLPLWKLADILAPSIALGHAFGRLGCFLNGCCYGRSCSLPWAVHFPYGHETFGQAVHPTQLYESALNAALYAGLAWLFRHKRFDGQVFAAYLIGYASVRFSVEFFRGDYAVRYLGGWATSAQVLSLAIFAAGVILWNLRAGLARSSGNHRAS